MESGHLQSDNSRQGSTNRSTINQIYNIYIAVREERKKQQERHADIDWPVFDEAVQYWQRTGKRIESVG